MRYYIPFTTLVAAALAFGSTALLAEEDKPEKPKTEKVQAEKPDKPETDKPSSDKQDSKKGAQVEVASTFKSADVVGMEVQNKEGKDLGTIEDLVVDMKTGKLRYAALSRGGFAGVGDKLFAIPWKAFTVKFAEDDQFLVLNVSEQQLESAKGFNQDRWPNVADPKWAEGIDKQFASEELTDEAKDEDKAAESKEAKSSTEKSEGDGADISYDAVYRVSNIKGLEVRDKAGKDLGHIEEIVLDLKKGQVTYAALSMGGVLGVGDKLFAVPFKEFQFKHEADEKFFVVNVSEKKLKSAPGFDQDNWPDTAKANWASEIDRHYELSKKPEKSETRNR
jgi:sporulation protein YlmC with PRC-barrel domain